MELHLELTLDQISFVSFKNLFYVLIAFEKFTSITTAILTGAALDWVRETLHTNISYAYEFRDTGATGFILPPDQILPNSIEIFASIIRMMQEGYKMGIA